MNTDQRILDQILELSEAMLAYGASAEWEQLMISDTKRAALVSNLQPLDMHKVNRDTIEQIRALQSKVEQIVLDERTRIENEYVATKNKLSASSSYLEHMESRLT